MRRKFLAYSGRLLCLLRPLDVSSGGQVMTKLSMLGMISGAALLTAVPFSLQWSQNNVTLSFDSAEARIGRPLTATSIAGVNRRVHRRAYRRAAVYAGAAGVGYGLYSGYGYPGYSSSYSYPAYSYGGYGYGSPAYGYGYSSPAYGYGYGGLYRPALYGGYRVARRVAINRARWD
jgi:hypothetical protein